MMAKRLASTALTKPAMMPLVYCVSNLKIKTMPEIIKIPAMISIFEIRFLLIIGSKIAVKSVMDDRQTSVTGTVESLIEAKKRIQWPPTKAPVNTNFKAVLGLTMNAVLLNLKYKNSEILAISTLYQTKFTAEMEIN